MSEKTISFDKQAADSRLTTKVAAMSMAERDARVEELYADPDRNSPEKALEWTKLMFGEDLGIE